MGLKFKPRRTLIVTCSLGLFLLVLLKIQRSPENVSKMDRVRSSLRLDMVDNLPETLFQASLGPVPEKADLNCKMYNCFNIYRCKTNIENPNTIMVYLYPLTKYVDENRDSISPPMSREFLELYDAIANSPYYTSDPNEACIFIPSLDLLSQNGLNIRKIGQILASLPNWNLGHNNLIFNMVPGTAPEFSTAIDVPHDKAIVAGGGFSTWTYRTKFDVSVPIYSPLASSSYLEDRVRRNEDLLRAYLLVSSQINLHYEYRSQLEILARENSDFLLLEKCRNVPDDIPLQRMRCSSEDKHMYYPQVLDDGVFCLILPTNRLGQSMLSDAMSRGCIPVFVCDTYVLPFSEVLDWPRASVLIQEENLENVLHILKQIPLAEIDLKRKQVHFYYREYFSSMRAIVLSTLTIINDRVFPQNTRTYEEWNQPPDVVSVNPPLFLPMVSPKEDGFTVVILAYDRVQSLFQLILSLDQVPSLSMILVVWNNQNKPYPPLEEWPFINHRWKVIQTDSNKLSNRFFPYSDIQTEAVLAIDDDIIMLTVDEIEFGYQVWREFPDRVVGFPPRLHLWTENAQIKYESEWKNNISIVLTGAAFYHNYYNYLYTYKMPGDIKDWVDDHMNCEDIAMNFVASNHSGKAPIKVTPRKKFKCSECETGGSISLDESHMVERSECMNYFMDTYGMLPLKSVNFRADPVLFKDDFPEKLKQFANIGSL